MIQIVQIAAQGTTVTLFDDLDHKSPMAHSRAVRVIDGTTLTAMAWDAPPTQNANLTLQVCLDDEVVAPVWHEVWDLSTGAAWTTGIMTAHPAYYNITPLIAPMLQIASVTDDHKFHGMWLRPTISAVQDEVMNFYFAFTRR